MNGFNLRVICPHCGYEFDDDETWHSQYGDDKHVVNTGDCEESNVECHSCEQGFNVYCEQITMFKSSTE